MLQVAEIFTSVDGEVNYFGQGRPTTFIRFAGCNLQCPYCDTSWTTNKTVGTAMTVEQILKKIESPKITLTGGEPLLQPIEDLQQLCSRTRWVSMETNGTLDIAPIRSVCNCIIMNYKRQAPPIPDNYKLLRSQDYVKIMIDDPCMLSLGMINPIIRSSARATFCLSPVLDKVPAGQVVDFIIANKLWNVQLNVQLHKFIEVR